MSPPGGIRVECVVVDETNPDVLVVGLAELADCSGDSLILQRPRVGRDGYSVSNGSGATTLGGIFAWKLDDRWLRFSLTDDAALTLGCPPILEVELRVDPETLRSLREALVTVLGSPTP